MSPIEAPTRSTPLLSPEYRWATIGMVALIFLAAFEELAVTTVMPVVTAALDGRSWYAVAFSVTLAASVVGTVAGGIWADARGPVAPLLATIALFVLGLVVAGLAPSIEVFVAGRLLQGLGVGGVTVSLYVLVARIFATADHPRIFGAFAAAWVIPSVVGPTLAGLVAQALSWRWVFLGVVAIAAAAVVCLLPSIRAVPGTRGAVPVGSRRRLLLAAVAAVAVATLDLGGRQGGVLGVAVAVFAAGVVLFATRQLLPTGTFGVHRGLPAVIALRALIAGTFFAAEIYLPYLLQAHYDAPPWLSGITLTTAAFGWAGASQVQGRLGTRLTDSAALQYGAALLLVGVALAMLTAALHLAPVVLAVAWFVAGAGMGLQFPRIGTYVLAVSALDEQGANTASMTIADAVGGSTSIAVTGLLFTSLGTAADLGPFVAALSWTTALAVVAVFVSRRTANPSGGRVAGRPPEVEQG